MRTGVKRGERGGRGGDWRELEVEEEEGEAMKEKRFLTTLLRVEKQQKKRLAYFLGCLLGDHALSLSLPMLCTLSVAVTSSNGYLTLQSEI